jgi:hypothetical protein
LRCAQIGADGASSEVLAGLEALSARVRGVGLKENRSQTRVYRTLIMPLPKGDPDWPNTASYSQHSAAGRVLECLPTKEGARLALPGTRWPWAVHSAGWHPRKARGGAWRSQGDLCACS